MRVVFVRHGEGHHNVNNLYSLPEFELTEKGKKQAKAAADRIVKLPIDIIVSSPYKRTLQTTEIINKQLGKEIILSDLAIEVVRPTEIAGKDMSHPEVKAIRKQLDDNFDNEDWHFSDEENFYDLQNRAQKFIEYLETLDQDNILVVSHGVFIKMVVMVIVLKQELSPQGFLNGYHTMSLETSGLTLCDKTDKSWKLITWNDHSHLG